MSFIKLNRNHFENFTVRTHVPRTFISGVGIGMTGTVPVLSERSNIEYEFGPNASMATGTFQEVITANKFGDLIESDYSASRIDERKQVYRDRPSVVFSKDTIKKNLIINTLFPYYRTFTPSANFSYTNYHTLNFFTASNTPNNSALMYPVTGAYASGISGAYSINTAFTFEFWINPRYSFTKAGTVFHLSSNYAVSLVTGSNTFDDGTPSHYRVLLQLSQSTGYNPTSSLPGVTASNGSATRSSMFTFLSNDNVLHRNHWHHVSIAWDVDKNDGTGSFYIDTAKAGNFNMSQSIPHPPDHDPGVLVVGNYYAGDDFGSNALSNFFNSTAAENEGVNDIGGVSDDPNTNTTPLNNPLNAEIHELRIFNYRRDPSDIKEYAYKSLPKDMLFNTGSGLLFYLPPFFTTETRQRDVKLTPFQTIRTTTDDPFNVALSMGVDGYEVNLENFVRDFAQGEFPKLYNLTASTIDTTTQLKLANEFLEEGTGFHKRNLTILPNDNGLFVPNFGLLNTKRMYTGSNALRRFKTDLKGTDLSAIRLSNMVLTTSLGSYTEVTGTMHNKLGGASPEEPGVGPGVVLTIPQRTRDVSSNEVCWFDISNLFYDKEISPRSIIITDENLSGSHDAVKITLKDDGYGGIYRGDSQTKHAIWNHVGNVFYSEGLVFIKSPHLRNFGKDKFKIQLSGTHNVHVLRTYLRAPKGLINSSSNPTYKSREHDNIIFEGKNDNVYISGINFYNNDFNVVGKVTFAQAIEKFSQDEYLFKITMDF